MPPTVRIHDTDDLSPDKQRDLACRKHYLSKAAQGDAEGRLMCRTFLHLTGWYSKTHGDVIGELSKVARERERQ